MWIPSSGYLSKVRDRHRVAGHWRHQRRGGNPIEALIAFILFFAAFLILQRRRFPWGSLPYLNVAFFLLLAYLALSVLWSPYPFVAFKRWFKEFGNVLIALVILTEKDPAESLRASASAAPTSCSPCRSSSSNTIPTLAAATALEDSPW